MKVVFAGKFECAMIRSIDEILSPGRNASTSEYYVGLNRKVPKQYFDRCGTFMSISESVLVPEVDWNYPHQKGHLADVNLGIDKTYSGGRERDGDTRALVRILLSSNAFSPSTRSYISDVVTDHYSDEDRARLAANAHDLKRYVADHYLSRLFLQVRAARDERAWLVLCEEDMRLLEEILTLPPKGTRS